MSAYLRSVLSSKILEIPRCKNLQSLSVFIKKKKKMCILKEVFGKLAELRRSYYFPGNVFFSLSFFFFSLEKNVFARFKVEFCGVARAAFANLCLLPLVAGIDGNKRKDLQDDGGADAVR
ncbi:hypothetical protein PUN28_006677 [Cardiocondyla obscurior]|uniref:Uncharacterized protein n=1 Tax=Cardiocondyla obscurior TaxID=286306 RepID=A0AAW2G175_9HYME